MYNIYICLKCHKNFTDSSEKNEQVPGLIIS